MKQKEKWIGKNNIAKKTWLYKGHFNDWLIGRAVCENNRDAFEKLRIIERWMKESREEEEARADAFFFSPRRITHPTGGLSKQETG